MSTVFSEEENVMPERKFAIVDPPRNTAENRMPTAPPNSLADYVLRVMREKSLTYPDVERIARRRKGSPSIGKSTVQQIAQGKTPNPGIFTLVELSWGLGRPVEEVIAAALGTPATESSAFHKSEAANIFEMSKQLPLNEQKVIRRYLQMIEREVQRILSSE